MEFRFCHICGEELSKKDIGDEGVVPYCIKCNKPFFDIVCPCVLIAVINQYGEVALLKQQFGNVTANVLVAGYIKKGESVEEAAVREVQEETGQDVVSLRYIKSYFYEPKDMVMLSFMAYVNKRAFNFSKEVLEIAWYPATEAVKMMQEGIIARRHLQMIIDQELINKG